MAFIGRVIFTSTKWSTQIRFTNKFNSPHVREREREPHIVDREMVEVSVMQQHEHTSQY